MSMAGRQRLIIASRLGWPSSSSSLSSSSSSSSSRPAFSAAAVSTTQRPECQPSSCRRSLRRRIKPDRCCYGVVNTATATHNDVSRRAFSSTGRVHAEMKTAEAEEAEAAAGTTSPASAEGGTDESPFITPRVENLYDRMTALTREELAIVGQLVNEKLGVVISPAELELMSGGGIDRSGDIHDAEQQQEEDEEQVKKEEKRVFDLKLVGFDAKAKIKVIKEVRTITGLGLKEAKEMVEGAPKVLKKDVKKEEAEALQKKLQDVGATVEIA